MPVPRWRRALGTVGAVGAFFLGAVFLVAVFAKVIDPHAFTEHIEAQGLAIFVPAFFVATLALALEAALGLALVLNIRRSWVLYPSLALVAFFLFLTGRAYFQSQSGGADPMASCGCFGNLVDRSPKEAFYQDILLLVPAMALAFLGRPKGDLPFPWPRFTAVAVFVTAVLGFAWKAPDLPLDNFATRLKPGVDIEEVCAGEGDEAACLDTIVPEMLEGRHLVVIADLEDPRFTAEVGRLSEYALSEPEEMLWVVSSSSPQAQEEFYWSHGPAFEVREGPLALLRPLYRRLPRSFVVDEGVVVETHDGIPTLEIPMLEPGTE